LSVPAPRRPRQSGGRWETIRYALDSNARTFRLCLILLVTIVAPVAAAVVAELIRHTLLCGIRQCPALRLQWWPGRGLLAASRPPPSAGRRGGADLDAVAESTGAAGLQREREQRYRKDRESWRARLREYQAARQVPVMPRDGWLGLDDEDEWAAMLLSRWPVPDDAVRGPPHGDGSVNSTACSRAAG